MTGPQRPFASSPGPYNSSPFTVPVSGTPSAPPPLPDNGRKFLTWRMLRLVAALVALLAVVVLGIRILLPPPEPVNASSGIPANITPTSTLDAEEFKALLDEGIAKFNASVAEKGGVNAALTSHLLAPGGNSLLQVSSDPEGNHIVYSFDLLAEPTPIRFTRGDNTFINTVTPYPGNTTAVAKIRDSEFVGEWSLSDPNDPTSTVPTLPELATSLGEGVESAKVGTSPDGLVTQVIIEKEGLRASDVPAGLLSGDIEGMVQLSYLFDKDKRLVGMSVSGEAARAGDGNAPQIIYTVPVEGFAAVEVPDAPENPGVAPENLPATGAWSNLVTLATDIQRSGRQIASELGGENTVSEYTADITKQILLVSSISEQLVATQSTFDPATNLLRDDAGRIVCLPLGPVNPGSDMADTPAILYLDLCPVIPENEPTEQS